MSNYSKMYWLTRLDYIQGLVIFFIVLSCIGLIIYYIGKSSAGDWEFNKADQERKRNRFITSFEWVRKVCYPLMFSSLIILTFIPSQNDMIFIYAGGKTMNFVESDSSINKIPAQTTKIITDYLDKKIKESENK